MPESLPIRLCRLVITCFPRVESSNIDHLILIPSPPRARAVRARQGGSAQCKSAMPVLLGVTAGRIL